MSPGERRRRDRVREPLDWDVYDHPPPIPVADGIRAKSRRGDIGATWWSRRFVAALESYYGTSASRLARGRSYARAGQVVRIGLEPGRVEAIVQGSRPEPYTVRIGVRVLGNTDWASVEAAMAARAVFLARLLAGEMPDEIEEAFDAAEVRLFPARRGDLVTACTCPDTANPCKHSAAVYYLLAESFDADPFRIFAWRGRPREQLIADLRALRPASGRGGGRAVAKARVGPAARVGPPGGRGPSEPETLERFWDGSGTWREVAIDPRPTGPAMGSSETSTRRSLSCSVPRPWSSFAPCTTPPLEPRAGDWICGRRPRPGGPPERTPRITSASAGRDGVIVQPATSPEPRDDTGLIYLRAGYQWP